MIGFHRPPAMVGFGIGLSVASVVVRFQRSRGVERQQLKWFVAAAGSRGVVIPNAFAERLRDEVELGEIHADIHQTVHSTVRPAHVGIWLRSADNQASRSVSGESEHMPFTIEDTYDAPGVDAAVVYACYADPSTWHLWGHNTSGARARMTVETGAIVDVKVRRYPWTYAAAHPRGRSGTPSDM